MRGRPLEKYQREDCICKQLLRVEKHFTGAEMGENSSISGNSIRKDMNSAGVKSTVFDVLMLSESEELCQHHMGEDKPPASTTFPGCFWSLTFT